MKECTLLGANDIHDEKLQPKLHSLDKDLVHDSEKGDGPPIVEVIEVR